MREKNCVGRERRSLNCTRASGACLAGPVLRHTIGSEPRGFNQKFCNFDPAKHSSSNLTLLIVAADDCKECDRRGGPSYV